MNKYNFYIGILIVGLSNIVNAQFYPYNDSINYYEKYRGQFHFSPKSEWMNDINGLVYQGGKYHMIFQWAKYQENEKIWHPRMGGYATSKDLLHWTDKGVALIPQRDDLPKGVKSNTSGNQIYSGSAVVVNGDVSKKITGSNKEAIVAIYTGTSVGTCLAWSNDTGITWHNYIGNPVANTTSNDYPRDPCVKWHKESKNYIMALYENGTTFYRSKDLIIWDSISNIKFGYECPDFFELPLNGNPKQMKWVVMDAKGKYLIGIFDGVNFKKDDGQDTLLMTIGPDFYAAQCFSRGNLPNNDTRIIQIAWMDCWNGGIGESPWQRNATFPVELGLLTYNGQQRLTRNPIKEISSIYENTIIRKNQLLKKGSNILSEIKSKKFDLTVEIDLTNTTATEIGFNIANKTISYSIPDKKLLGYELEPNNQKHIKIRILVDWGQLEVFAANGVYSYAEQFAFDQSRNDLVFFTNGDIKLVSMEFHEIKRIWK